MDTDIKTKINSKFIFAVIIILVIIAALLLSVFVYQFIEKNEAENKTEVYYQLSDKDIEALFEISNNRNLMFDKKSYNIFNDKCLGNNSSTLLSFGCYCEKDGMVCISKDKTVLTVGDEEIVISDSPSSYINIIDDNIYYREDSTRKLYKYSISNNTSMCIVDSPCGEVVVSKKGISYIELASSTLKHIAFATKETIQVIPEQVKSFVVIGNSYYCLKGDKTFGIISPNGEFDLITTDVDRFFCNGKIAIQKGSNIYVLSDANNLETQFTGLKGVLVGFSDDAIYIYENQHVNSYKTSTNVLDKTIVTLKPSEILKSFYITDDTYEIITYSEDSSLYVKNYITINK